MSDAMLELIKSIDKRMERMEDRLETTLSSHDQKINEHSSKFARQDGVMVGGGVVVTTLAAIASWIVNIYSGSH